MSSSLLPRPMTILFLLASSVASVDHDWPRWRGPHGTNVSAEADFDASGVGQVVWRVDIGVGYSSPIVAGDASYVLGYFPSAEDPNVGRDRVARLDTETGEVVWAIDYPSLAYANEHRGGVIETPTLHGDTLFVASRQGELRALDVANGAQRWAVDLSARHGLDPGRYGFASSPLIDEGRLVVNMSRAVALDPASGETIWLSEPLDANYSTAAPMDLRLGGEGATTSTHAYAVFGGEGLFVLAAETGETLRRFEFRQTPRNVEGATPIVIGTDVFVSSGYDQGAALVDVVAEPPVARWRSRRMRTKLAGATLFEGHLYGHDESMLTCMDLTGQVMWRERGLGQGALSIAGGKLLLTSSEGELVVAEASPSGFVEHSRTALFEDDGVYWATPVLVDGRVYVRSSVGTLVCVDRRHAAQRALEGGVPDPTRVTVAALPSPDELEREHLRRMGEVRVGELSLTFVGKLHVVALGLEDVDATFGFAAGDRWHASFDLPPGIGGTILQAFDGENAWETNPYRGDKLLADATLQELRRTRGMRDLFDPIPAGFTARTVGREVFRGTPAYRVELEEVLEPPGEGATDEAVRAPIRRTLYFDAEERRLLGRTAPDEATVVLGDWRPVPKWPSRLELPFRRTTFEPETGLEHRWTFSTVESTEPPAERFALPVELRVGEQKR
jgi:outer membrane protein assembly factor BamB